MSNSQETPTGEQQQRMYELASHLYSAFFNNEKYVEALHEMFVAYAMSDGTDDEVINAYLNLRYFLRNGEEVFNPKNESHG